jgi:hypothetical protein
MKKNYKDMLNILSPLTCSLLTYKNISLNKVEIINISLSCGELTMFQQCNLSLLQFGPLQIFLPYQSLKFLDSL